MLPRMPNRPSGSCLIGDSTTLLFLSAAIPWRLNASRIGLCSAAPSNTTPPTMFTVGCGESVRFTSWPSTVISAAAIRGASGSSAAAARAISKYVPARTPVNRNCPEADG